jgi:hypothetical protein
MKHFNKQLKQTWLLLCFVLNAFAVFAQSVTFDNVPPYGTVSGPKIPTV